MQADLIIKDVLVFRTPKRVFEKMNVAIRGDQFYYLTNKTVQIFYEYIWFLFHITTCFYCPNQLSAGRALVHRREEGRGLSL